MSKSLKLYSIFHLNLMYSSIAEEQRLEVINKCYWPLLNLAEKYNFFPGIELTGNTLELIQNLDPNWVVKLKELIQKQKVELIGSGYAQIIGPLIPAEVNSWNLKIGNEIYSEKLGIQPQIVLINEQAYTSGLIEHYKNADYKAIIMEWNNPYTAHPNWKKEWRYFPQVAIDNNNLEISVIWNNSVAFQKFQRYAHKEIEINEYLEYLELQIGTNERCFSLYGNDIEIFDFRPGRFETEATLTNESEWKRIENLIQNLLNNPQFKFISPEKLLTCENNDSTWNKLQLESTTQPTPVKKQEKYNLTRWAVTGRADADINGQCYALCNYYIAQKNTNRVDWKELCWLWSSDFRTHVEEKRWQKYLKRLNVQTERITKTESINLQFNSEDSLRNITKQPKINLKTEEMKIELNAKKGLAIKKLAFKKFGDLPLIGTLKHGYFDNITYAADFFSGGMIVESPGQQKIADLEPIEPKIYENQDQILIEAVIPTKIGKVKKQIIIYKNKSKVDLLYNFDFKTDLPISIRAGIITLMPQAFDRNSLYYKTVNGGNSFEKFNITKDVISHNQPITKLVTAKTSLGATQGWIEMGDKDKFVRLTTDKSLCYNVPMIEFNDIDNTYFFRLYHSLQEIDETYRNRYGYNGKFKVSIETGIN